MVQPIVIASAHVCGCRPEPRLAAGHPAAGELPRGRQDQEPNPRQPVALARRARRATPCRAARRQTAACRRGGGNRPRAAARPRARRAGHRAPQRRRDLALALIVARLLEPAAKLATARMLDPATASPSLGVVLVGDRGVLTSARIEQTLRPAGLDWITALRAPAIKQLAAKGGPLQPSLFDDRDMAEITSPDYPGERLVVCKNPLLAEERARKRAELLAATENELARIAARVQRARNPLRGAAAIGQAVGAVLGRRHMAKHFQITIAANAFSFAQNPLSIAAEAALDGIYVIRTNLPAAHCDAAATVRAYKSLSGVEHAFRSLQTVDLELRPLSHLTAT